ncbi:hypothetical protein ACFSTC_34750 [Nonomuraea ferruginea]
MPDVDGRQAAEAAHDVVDHEDRVGLGHARLVGEVLERGQRGGLAVGGGLSVH